ncbi:MAG TPA: DUF4397 domain-containing protein [Bryobacteraceae bacterium]|jgi:hypothetical protein|nr:DUF4397 domain-containing protein [Bryobacteraceae bacterium]
MTLPAQNALVRVVHASADAPAVDVLINGEVAFEGLPFKSYTAHMPLPPGTYIVSLRRAGTTTAVYSETFLVQAGVTYTFLTVGRLSGGQPLHIRGVGDDLTPPPSGNVKFRVVHGASSAPAVDVYVTQPYITLAAAAPILRNVPFGSGSDYFTVPAGLYQARATAANSRTVAIGSGPLSLSGGIVRTLVAIDPVETNGSFDFLVLPDLN